MKPFTRLFLLLIACFATSQLYAQGLTQTIRGTIVDKISKAPLPGASVVVLDTNPIMGATTDPDGNFKLTKIPVGNHNLKITFIGYLDVNLPNVIVNSGKEVVLN